jgi:16S rRNA (guanine966-N2)-methyltransferase
MGRHRPGTPGRLRVIGGRYRGRRLKVHPGPGLRPTPERVRETLFNWLAPIIEGARCLDPFAGSGALGIEALSRGAAEVVMLERSDAVARVLRDNIRDLGERRGSVVRADARHWLKRPGRAFDIVFLDPPFAEDLLIPSCHLLAQHGWLAPGARVYLEAPASSGIAALPVGWRLAKAGRAGQVSFALAEAGDPRAACP